MSGGPMRERTVTVLGRHAYLGVIAADPSVLDLAVDRLADLDRRWQPNGQGSELAALRGQPGVAVRVSPDTVLLAEVDARRPNTPRRLFVDAAHQVVGLLADPAHQVVGLLADPLPGLGALAAALATDLAFADLIAGGAAGACVRLGGNLHAGGASPGSDGWPVDLETPVRTPMRMRRGAMSVVHGPGTRVAAVADQAWRAHLLADAARSLPAARTAKILVEPGTTARFTIAPDAQRPGDWRLGEWRSSLAA
jgi:thiamine biosynthesis lipoprotein ApbE